MKNSSKRLGLSTQTIRVLSSDDLQSVVGGTYSGTSVIQPSGTSVISGPSVIQPGTTTMSGPSVIKTY
ncbi:MAG TPA: hypothetical protein VIU61_07420 [Kofleriaceae bacterium]